MKVTNENVRRTYVSVPAEYRTDAPPRVRGNPFAEALASLGSSRDEILDRIAYYPPPPTPDDLKMSAVDRIVQLNVVKDIIYPLAAYSRAATHFAAAMPEAYVGCNPMQALDLQRRSMIAEAKQLPLDLPADWTSTATGQGYFGTSGSGKTTLMNRISLPYQVVIEHTNYKGLKFVRRQVPLIKLRTPHDATLKSLCLQFFKTVDSILQNTEYLKEAKTARSVAQMTLLMAQVATSISLAMILLDEIQNLRAARGPQAEFVLNLFSELIESAGVALTVVGTPAVLAVSETNVRNLRKLVSGGSHRFEAMKKDDPQLHALYDKYWQYSYVSKPTKLTPAIRSAWFDTSAGNPAFIALSYILAQRLEIGGRETVDNISFQRVQHMEMSILQPAISALKSGNKHDLELFDDLVFKPGIRDLMQIAGWSSAGGAGGADDQDADPDDELDEVKAAAAAAARKRAKGKKSTADQFDDISFDDLPVENPLKF